MPRLLECTFRQFGKKMNRSDLHIQNRKAKLAETATSISASETCRRANTFDAKADDATYAPFAATATAG